MSDLISRKRIEFELCESNIPKKYREFCRRVINSESLSPSVDAELVIHGHWIDRPTGRYGKMQSWCSACGEHSGIGGIVSNRHKPRCPNCGAKMDEEDNR